MTLTRAHLIRAGMAAGIGAAPVLRPRRARAQAKPELDKVVIAQGAQGFTYTPLFIAQEKGYFHDAGLDVSVVAVEGVQSRAALQTGQAHFGPATLLGVQSAAKGRYLTTVAGFVDQIAGDLVLSNAAITKTHSDKNQPIATRIKALSGLRIGIPTLGGLFDLSLRYVLPRYGLRPDEDVTLVPLGSGAALVAALQSGAIDSFLYSSPVPQDAEQRGLGKVVIRFTAGDVPDIRGILFLGYYGQPDFIKANPRTVQAFVDGMARALRLIKQRPADALAVAAKYNPSVEKASLETAFAGYLPAFQATPVVTKQSMALNVTLLKAVQSDFPAVDVDRLIDNSFAERAVARLR